ncbi:MAG: carboxyvinyl-carboxyphosphonate phosphorylmutase [Betaproteobacteria bacterium]|nr:carboxyvinyl-carboxyphosphonate phosphorylmutase [Betaproteobacteria bacterium]
MDRPTTRLRSLIESEKLLIAPGVADCLNARIAAAEGFDAIYMTGSGTAAVRLGTPDIGLLTMTEMVDNAQRIAEASQMPVIADADTGYGGPLNVQRTIRAYERAGVAAVHIEDQQWPKRCGHYAGKTLVPVEEMVSKIKAAVDARSDSDFAIIARTDAYSVEGFEQAIERGRHYQEAGADILFIEELRTTEQLAQVPATFRVPTLFNMAGSGKTPFLTGDEIQKLGFKIAIYPNFLLLAGIRASQRVLHELKKGASVECLKDHLAGWAERHELLGISRMRELEERYGVDDKSRVGLES